MSVRTIVCIGLVVSATAFASLDIAKATVQSRSSVDCPSGVRSASVVPASVVAKEAERLLPLALRKNYSPNEARGFFVAAVEWLAERDVPGADQLRARATALCGRRTAGASWGLVVRLPRVHVPISRQIAFIAKTRSGWRIYLGSPG